MLMQKRFVYEIFFSFMQMTFP